MLDKNKILDTSKLIIGKFYKIKSRNLNIAVWNGEIFIGIREKFDKFFLDSESPWTEHIGTVHEAIELDEFTEINLCFYYQYSKDLFNLLVDIENKYCNKIKYNKV